MKRYAIITGGELRNRGAQAMSFRTISALKTLFPQIEPVLFSSRDTHQPLVNRLHGRRNRSDIDNLAFRTAWSDLSLLSDDTPRYLAESPKEHAKRILRKYTHIAEARDMDTVFKDAAMCIDISGFAFGNQWGFNKCQRYLSKIRMMRDRSIPIYVMPQSFGPFDFQDPTHEAAIQSQASDLLAYPRMLCARERQGFADVLALCPEARCTLEEDLVLQGGEIDLTDVFVDPSLITYYSGIETERNVGIVPNARTFDHGDTAQLLALYGSLIEGLLHDGYNVYVIRHSEDDAVRCSQLKELFSDCPRVTLMNEDRYCFQYGDLFSRCDFLIASRFHAIVHAYRCGVPCVALGWATKYIELLTRFRQDEYVHDVRQLTDDAVSSVFSAVHQMEDRHQDEASRIRAHVTEIQARPSIFERVATDYEGLCRK